MKTISHYIKKHLTKEFIIYLIVGVLTTIIDLTTYYICTNIFGLDYRISNGIAWVVAVIFAFYANKYFVFNSIDNSFTVLLKELIAFIACRVFSGLFNMITLIIMVDVLHMDDFIAKVIVSIAVVIMNYVFSKLFIFKAPKELL